jgi:tRNA(Leu) C34 or U34 (ribose-2'-O)-methylase TrmL
MNKQSVHIGLINPKSSSNVGAVMRAVGCYRADAVYYTGTRYDLSEKFSTDTQEVSQSISLIGVNNLLEGISGGMKIVCVELVEGATLLPDFQHPDNVMYIFGPEDGTIEQSILEKADDVIYVPTVGCMNLAAAVNVVLYDRLAKSDLSFANDKLIRQSRDTNNNAKIT